MNWDVAIDVKTNRVGIGVIIGNSTSDIMACLCSCERLLTNPAVAETLAIRRALIMCSKLGLSDVFLEGNSHTIVRATNSNDDLCTDYGSIVMDTENPIC